MSWLSWLSGLSRLWWLRIVRSDDRITSGQHIAAVLRAVYFGACRALHALCIASLRPGVSWASGAGRAACSIKAWTARLAVGGAFVGVEKSSRAGYAVAATALLKSTSRALFTASAIGGRLAAGRASLTVTSAGAIGKGSGWAELAAIRTMVSISTFGAL